MDKYAKKKERVADLFFDLVKYLLTTLGAVILFAEKQLNPVSIAIALGIALIIFTVAVSPRFWKYYAELPATKETGERGL